MPHEVSGSRLPVGSSARKIRGRVTRRAGDGHALLLTAAELVGELADLVLEPDDPERLLHLLAHVALPGTGHLERERTF